MYSVHAFGRMLADTVRVDAYAEALRRSIGPGSVVVDLGAGTGAFSLLACRLGAARVYAIEPNPALAIARESAAASGFADRITFIDRLSTSAVLPEQADVLVSDLRGVLPPLGHNIAAVVDARRRFLRPGGVQIPVADELWVAPVRDDAAYRELREPWSALDLDMGAAQRYAVNVMQVRRVNPGDVVADAHCWALIDYRTVEDPSFAGSAAWQMAQPTTVNGLCLWFTAHLLDGLSYATSPYGEPTVYAMVFAPLAEELTLAAGDALHVRLRADLVGESYTWSWNTDVTSQHGTTRSFRQSTFFSSPPSLATRRAETARPETDDRGRAAAAALGLLDGARTLGEVADRLSDAFPALFGARPTALRFVADLAETYGVWGPDRGGDAA